MFQILGSAMIFFGCGYCGWMRGLDLKKKVRLTEEFIRALEMMKREITEKQRFLLHIIDDLAKKEKSVASAYFGILLQKLNCESQESFSVGWAESLKEELPVELTDILESLGGVLGQFDGKTQGEALRMVLSELRHLKGKQEETCEKMQQVYGAFGITMGVFLVILLI